MAQGFLDAEHNRLGGEEPLLHPHGFAKWIALKLGSHRHQTEQRAPIDRAAAAEMAGVSVE